MQIRLAKEEDLGDINTIYNQAVEQRFCTAHLSPVSLDYHKEWFMQHRPDRYPVFVLVSRSQVCGWASLGAYRPGRQALAHVGEVSYYVHRHERGRGFGSKLLEHIIRVAPGFDMTVLIAILLSRNPASIALLEKYGFKCWGSMPGIARIDHESADHLYFGLKL